MAQMREKSALLLCRSSVELLQQPHNGRSLILKNRTGANTRSEYHLGIGSRSNPLMEIGQVREEVNTPNPVASLQIRHTRHKILAGFFEPWRSHPQVYPWSKFALSHCNDMRLTCLFLLAEEMPPEQQVCFQAFLFLFHDLVTWFRDH